MSMLQRIISPAKTGLPTCSEKIFSVIVCPMDEP
jgi:hypothetical protein